MIKWIHRLGVKIVMTAVLTTSAFASPTVHPLDWDCHYSQTKPQGTLGISYCVAKCGYWQNGVFHEVYESISIDSFCGDLLI